MTEPDEVVDDEPHPGVVVTDHALDVGRHQAVDEDGRHLGRERADELEVGTGGDDDERVDAPAEEGLQIATLLSRVVGRVSEDDRVVGLGQARSTSQIRSEKNGFVTSGMTMPTVCVRAG